MKLMTFWHYSLIPYMPDKLLIKMFKNCYKLCNKKIKKKINSLALYTYIHTILIELSKRRLLLKQYYKFYSKFEKVFKFEIYDEVQMIQLYDTSFTCDKSHLKCHDLKQLRISYNELKRLFIKNNTPLYIRKKAHDTVVKYKQ